jgi:hypothetical protein
MAGLTDISMGYVKIITSYNRGVNFVPANITGKGLHIKLL